VLATRATTLVLVIVTSMMTGMPAFVAGALQELSYALCKGNGRMNHASMFSLARAAGRHFAPGCDVPVAKVGEVYFALVLLTTLFLLLAWDPREVCAVCWSA
jgi:hypothetical protein